MKATQQKFIILPKHLSKDIAVGSYVKIVPLEVSEDGN